MLNIFALMNNNFRLLVLLMTEADLSVKKIKANYPKLSPLFKVLIYFPSFYISTYPFYIIKKQTPWSPS